MRLTTTVAAGGTMRSHGGDVDAIATAIAVSARASGTARLPRRTAGEGIAATVLGNSGPARGSSNVIRHMPSPSAGRQPATTNRARSRRRFSAAQSPQGINLVATRLLQTPTKTSALRADLGTLKGATEPGRRHARRTISTKERARTCDQVRALRMRRPL